MTTPLRPYIPSATLRRIARATWIGAVGQLCDGDRYGYFETLRRVDALEEMAREAVHYEEECRGTARAIERILSLAGRDKSGGRTHVESGER